jgi:hypothetical protein
MYTALLIKPPERLKKLKQSKFYILRLTFKVLKGGFFIIKLICIPSFRGIIFSRIRFKKYFHQISHYTEVNRYPDLFEICRDHLSDKTNLRILSFGCSTGEEVFSLGEYLPRAKIVGTDISKWCIKECLKKPHNDNFEFLHSKSEQFSRMDNFDAIFCLAVFQHPDNRRESAGPASEYLFSQFEQQLIMLDTKLRNGGLLFIDNCDFNFFETIVSKKYSPLNTDRNRILRERPIYDHANNKILDITYTFRVFVKNIQ